MSWTKRRYQNAKLNQQKIDAAWKLYEAGLSVPQIADKVWERYGYASPKQCAVKLRLAFVRDRKVLRNRTAAARLVRATCSGCGCPSEARTRGCKACIDRHYARRARAAASPRPAGWISHGRVRAQVCLGCGCGFDGRTVGCRQCFKRHWNRTSRRNSKGAALRHGSQMRSPQEVTA